MNTYYLPLHDTFVDEWEGYVAGSSEPNALLISMAELEDVVDQLEAAKAQYEQIICAIERRVGDLSLTAEQQSASFEAGTAQLKHQTVHNVTDWDAFYQWIAQDPLGRMTGFLHKRAGSTAIGKFAESNDGELPPGCVEAQTTKLVVKTKR